MVYWCIPGVWWDNRVRSLARRNRTQRLQVDLSLFFLLFSRRDGHGGFKLGSMAYAHTRGGTKSSRKGGGQSKTQDAPPQSPAPGPQGTRGRPWEHRPVGLWVDKAVGPRGAVALLLAPKVDAAGVAEAVPTPAHHRVAAAGLDQPRPAPRADPDLAAGQVRPGLRIVVGGLRGSGLCALRRRRRAPDPGVPWLPAR